MAHVVCSCGFVIEVVSVCSVVCCRSHAGDGVGEGSVRGLTAEEGV